MDTLFFIVSKLIGALLQPTTWIVITLGMIILSLIFGRQKPALIISVVTFVALLVLSILPLGALLLQPIERSFPTNPLLSRVDGIIVLGGGEDARTSSYWGQAQLNEGAERYTAAVAIAQRFPEARVLFTGGSGALRGLMANIISEAAMAEQFFSDLGVPQERLLLEGRSRNTAENARLSFALAQPTSNESWVLITSAFHMPRAIQSFKAAGWTDLVPYPVDYRTAKFVDGIGWNLSRNMLVLNTAIKEKVGQLAYRLAGR